MYVKKLKQFIGLANYFKDIIRNYSQLMAPLNQQMQGYDKNKSMKIIWDETTSDAFNTIKLAINDCPTLYFRVKDAPVFLHTDASDYGIGAYLFQIVKGREQAVAFISKSLSSTQKRWHTPQ